MNVYLNYVQYSNINKMVGGGKREGAGRPVGSGKFKETTRAIRVPLSLVDKIIDYSNNKGYELPLFSSKVSAGFPSPADDYMERKLDLNEYLIQQPAATFFVRATGNSMIGAGIYPDDILIVDRSIKPKHGKIVIAALNGDLTVKRLSKVKNIVKLVAENPDYASIEIGENDDLHIWGVVTNVIHKL
jgi:DNA polymerase V